MEICGRIWPEGVAEKIGVKHHLAVQEVEALFRGSPRVFFAEEGDDLVRICISVGSVAGMRKSKGGSKIPSFHTAEEVQEFWAKHSVTEFEGKLREVPVNVRLKSIQHQVAIEPSWIAPLRRVARSRGLSTESVVNLWLHGKLTAVQKKGAA